MDVFDEEILAFWRQLDQQNVRYIMLGGFATNFHGYSRGGKITVAEIEGVPVRFLHYNHLIESKKAANRLKDQLDVQELEKIRRLGEER